MNSATRTMIVLDAGASRFQFRVGGVIRCNGHILVHRATTDPFWCLPGGRVELHETSAQALAREIEEEIGCPATVGPLRFVIENFFEVAGRQAHEVGFYHEAELSRPLPFHEDEIVHRVRDGHSDLEFRWAAATQMALAEFDLKPMPLCELIENMPSTVQHAVQHSH